ncbi:MAG: FG-GAP-like repeat-containing protein [Limisphaerales bacterium]
MSRVPLRSVTTLLTLFAFVAHLSSALTKVHAAAAGGAPTRSPSPGLPFHPENGFRFRELQIVGSTAPGFSRLAPESTGITFSNHLAAARSLTNHILLNGSGVAIGDIDGDGLPDLFYGGLDGDDALYRNRGGWRFDVDTPPGCEGAGRETTGVAFADLDGDRDLDLLVNAIGRGTTVHVNPGDGRFDDGSRNPGVASRSGSTSLALADVDGDGDLDLYVANYRTSTIRDRFGMRLGIQRVNGRLVVTTVDGRPTTEPDLIGRFSVDADGKLNENGESDTLFLNVGGGRFEAQPFTTGRFLDEDGKPLLEPPYDWSLSAMFRDIDRDGAPDLYVCGDLASPDRIWMNLGDGRFRAAPKLTLRKTSWFSMGVDFADLNGDGWDEFFVTDMVSRHHRLRQVQVSNHQAVPSIPGVIDDRPQAPRNTLFLNLGDGGTSEIAHAAGVAASDWSWAPVFLDVDLDGHEDLLIATGFERDVQDIDVANELEAVRKARNLGDAESLAMRERFPPLRQANLVFRNRGDLTFQEMEGAWGFSDVGIAQGMALGDLDGDGDLDIVINELNGAAAVYRNNTSAPRIAVRLRGLPPNTQGIGARITLTGGAVPIQSQEMIAGGRYLSSDEPLRVFAAGPQSPSASMSLEVRWRNGRKTRIPGVVANRLYEIEEPADPPTSTHPTANAKPPARSAASDADSSVPPETPWFEDSSRLLHHRHVERMFDDQSRQPLLPRRLSQAGPGVAWHDLDRDGWVDLVVGSGRGGGLGIFRNDRAGGFVRLTNQLTRPVSRDLTGLAVWESSESVRLLVAQSNYEGAPGEPSSVMQIDPAAETVADAAPPAPMEPGPLALADIDGDGDLDLFVGGRVISGRYPEAADSRLFRREPTGWIPDEGNTRLLRALGLVNGAVFTDLDGDGFPELALACDWGPVRILRNNRSGGFTDATVDWKTDSMRGWWQGVTAGDLDGDGRMDLIAANWGTNTRYQTGPGRPLAVFYGDFNGGGGVDLLEAYTDPDTGSLVPWHHLGRVRNALPFVQERFQTYRAFGEAGIDQILGDRRANARILEANWLATTAFLNRGDRFEAKALPQAAQWAPAFGVVVADFDGDGAEDVGLAQNFFANDPETDRHDGGRGLVLRGDGRGGLAEVPAARSGLRIHGEQRGMAVADFDQDGRTDLVVGQNGQDTRLFRNSGGSHGLRVRLQGPPGNPLGIGAVLRLEFDGDSGPAREIHAGSGYLSQDSPVTVLATPRPPRRILIRWPGGGQSRQSVPEGAREIQVQAARP